MLNLTTSYVVEFDIAALILTFMLLFTLMLRRTFPTVAIKQYKYLLLCNIISSIADLFSAYTICNPEIVSLPVNYAINITYIMFHNITAVFFLIYIIAAIRKNLGTKPERILWGSLISIVVLFTLTTPLTKAIFYFDENGVYMHGNLFAVFYIIPAVSVFYSMYLIIKYRYNMSNFQQGTNFVFILLIVSSILFQVIFSKCLIENFIIATACLIMNAALDNPATYFYQSTGCFNQSAFNAYIETRLTKKLKFALIALAFDDLSIVKKQLTQKEYDEFVMQTIKRGHKIAGRKNFFALKDESYVMIYERDDADDFVALADKSLTRPYEFTTGKKIVVSPHYCILRFPGEATTYNDVNLVIHDTLTYLYLKTGTRIIGDSTKLLSALRREAEVVHVLREAIRNDGITVRFQPMLNLNTGKFSCAEALVRLRDNTLGIFPEEFIPIAEKNGLIVDIGAIMLEHVCSFIKESGCLEYGIKHINVNLSMMQLINKPEVERLVAICRKYEIEPQTIVFEVTETASEGKETASVLANIKYLKDSGFMLSLDDYGTGYSNLNNLIRFSIDQVKIDKDLLWSAVQSKESMSVLENAIMLVQNFGKNCVVEGVEDERMERILARLKVDYLQGFRYSRPITALALIKFLKDKNIQHSDTPPVTE